MHLSMSIMFDRMKVWTVSMHKFARHHLPKDCSLLDSKTKVTARGRQGSEHSMGRPAARTYLFIACATP